MPAELSRSPNLAELIRAAIDNRIGDIHTSIPGRIESFDAATQTADIKPLLKRRAINSDGTEINESIPVIPRVPICFPRAGLFYITWPVESGDLCELVFSEQSRDNLKAAGGVNETDPDDFRRFDLSDAFAIPGGYPEAKAIADFDSENIAIGKDNGGAVFRLKPDGNVAVVPAGSGKVHIGADPAALAIARLTDKTISDVTMSAWITLVTNYLIALAPLFNAPSSTPVVAGGPGFVVPPVQPTDFGIINTAASKATAE